MFPSLGLDPRPPGAATLRWLLTIGLAHLGVAVTIGQTAERGELFSSTFTIEDYGAHQQNWQVVQGADGVIYVANPQGVLVYDGARWEVAPHPDEGHVSALACSDEGVVYYGTAGDLGRLERDVEGRVRFVSLLARLDEPPVIGFVQQILATPEGVFFAAGTYLFRWTPAESRMKLWGIEVAGRDAYSSVSWIGNECIVAMIGRGLLAVDGDELVPLPGAAALGSIEMEVAAVLPWDDGELLLATVRSGLFLYDGESARRWDAEINELLTRRDTLFLSDCLALRDGRLVATTTSDGAWIFGRDGTLDRHPGSSSAMSSANVLDAHQDEQGGMWLATGDGVVRFEVESPLERFGREHGLRGNVLALARRGGTLHVGTDEGLFVLEPASSMSAPAQFRQVLPGPILDLLVVEERLFAAAGESFLELDSNFGGSSWSLLANRLALDPVGGYVYVGTAQEGVFRLDLGETGAPVEWLADPRSVDRLVVTPEGEAWIVAERPDLSKTLVRALPGGAAPVTTLFDEARGLPATRNLEPILWNGELIVGTTRGVYRPEGDRFVPDRRLEVAAGAPLTAINAEEDVHGRLWFWSAEGESARAERIGGDYFVERPLARAGPMNFFTFLAEGDVVWAGSASGRLIRYTEPTRPRTHVPRALVRRVTSLARPEQALGLIDGDSSPPRLPYSQNSLRFEYSSPSYDGPELNEYRTRLVGLEDEWSAWSSATYRDFTGLWEGDYRFEVQARDAHGAASPPVTSSFRLRPPAARTWWAYAGYVILACGVVSGLVRVRVRATRRKLDLLRAEITQREAAQREKEALAEQLRQAQKMESLGLLAGGISHDFNNLLTVILGHADLLAEQARREAWSDESLLESLEEIRETGARAAALTRQLLAFSRKQLLEPTVVDPNASIRAVEGLLRRLVREDVNLQIHIDDGVGTILVDPGQLEQVLMNLVVNASDAMGTGGTVTIRSRRVDLVEGQSEDEAPPPGTYVVLSVEDTGTGIDPAVLPRVFEPFFTTKQDGAGTGLGLASALGIVEQSGGQVRVVSEVGRGSTFEVWFPGVDEVSTAMAGDRLEADAVARAGGLPAQLGAPRASVGTRSVHRDRGPARGSR